VHYLVVFQLCGQFFKYSIGEHTYKTDAVLLFILHTGSQRYGISSVPILVLKNYRLRAIWGLGVQIVACIPLKTLATFYSKSTVARGLPFSMAACGSFLEL